MSSTPVVLVTGASGPLGSAVLHHLIYTLNVEPTRIVAATRTPAKLDQFAIKGVHVRRLDFNDPPSLLSASEGVDRALLISADGTQVGRRVQQHQAAFAAFLKAGVNHVLYTSLPGISTSNPAVFVQEHDETEKLLAQSEFPGGYTILRNGVYSESQFGTWQVARKTGEWNTAMGKGKIAYITRDDLGLANAIALANTSTGQIVYTLTGKEAVTADQVVKQYNRVFETAIKVKDVSEDFITAQIQSLTGWEEDRARIFAIYQKNIRDGYGERITDDFVKLTGKDPMTVSEWLEANKDVLLSL